MKKNYFSRPLSHTTCRIIKTSQPTKTILSSLEVKSLLLKIGFDSRSVALIKRKQTAVWIARGLYRNHQSVATIGFLATAIRLHKKSPKWQLACPHVPILIRKQPYQINEVGADIFLEKIIQK